MRVLAVSSIVQLLVLGGKVLVGDSELEALFPDGSLRYKSCQVVRSICASMTRLYEIIVRPVWFSPRISSVVSQLHVY